MQKPNFTSVQSDYASHEKRREPQRLRNRNARVLGQFLGSDKLFPLPPRTSGDGGFMIVAHDSRTEILFVLFLVILSAFSG